MKRKLRKLKKGLEQESAINNIKGSWIIKYYEERAGFDSEEIISNIRNDSFNEVQGT